MNKYPKADVAVYNLLKNRRYWGEKSGIGETDHNPPSPHYPHIYFWDEIAAAIIHARHGALRWQKTSMRGLNKLVEGQREDGFIANKQFFKAGNKLAGRKIDPEDKFFGKDATSS